MTPSVAAAGVGDFELEVVGGSLATQVKADLESLWQSKVDFLACHHKTAAAVEIVVEPQSRFAAGPLNSRQSPFRLTRRDDLPRTRVVEKIGKGIK